jgi:uncharacterized membrane protein YphA (DoxX/SURF4 family)
MHDSTLPVNQAAPTDSHSSATPSLAERAAISNLGIYVYGLSAIFLGLVGFAFADFAVGWQRVPADVPLRVPLAYLCALCELLAGASLLWRRSARVGAAVLGIIYAIFTLSWLRQAVAAPRIYDSWGNVFEELSMAIAGAVLVAALAPSDSPWAAKKNLITRVYGICPISFGIVHLVYLRGAATWVPKWLPPGQVFWTVATAIFFFMSAAAILTGILTGLAARLLTVMIVCFEFLIWLPKLLANPHGHFEWAGNGIALAMGGAAWVISDSLNASQKSRRP